MSGILNRFLVASLVFCALPAHAQNTRSQPSPDRSSKPYGAVSTQDTDAGQFTASMLQQFRAAKIPLPRHYDFFPQHNTEAANADSKKRSIIGESSEGSGLDDKNRLNQPFEGESVCADYVIKQQYFEAWRTKTALHEAAHYVAQHIHINGALLELNVFNAINKSSTQNPDSYVKKLEKSFGHATQKTEREKDPKKKTRLKKKADDLMGKLIVADVTAGRIGEEIADVSAVLYMLSNYGDNPYNRTFMQAQIDFRVMDFTDDDHEASPSMQAAIKIFDAAPRHGMSIVETTLWAAEIIKQRPEYGTDFQTTLHNINMHRLAKGRLFDRLRPPETAEEFSLLPARDQDAVAREADRIVAARNRSCVVATKPN